MTIQLRVIQDALAVWSAFTAQLALFHAVYPHFRDSVTLCEFTVGPMRWSVPNRFHSLLRDEVIGWPSELIALALLDCVLCDWNFNRS